MPRTLALFLFAFVVANAQPADLVLKNGRIVTLDVRVPEGRAIAVRGGRVVQVGSEAAIGRLTGPNTRVIDLRGALAIPAFIEGHGHFMGIGQAKMNLNLMGARNWDEIVGMVRAAAKEAKPGAWILGRGWHQSKWDKTPEPSVHGFPTAAELTKAAPQNPVLLTHASGHAAIVNGEAMKLAGITSATKDPVGGEVLKDAEGQPTGVLNETAQGLVRRALAAYEAKQTPAERVALARRQATLAAEECISKGIASFQDAGSSFDTIDLFKDMAGKNELPLRLWVMMRSSLEELTAKAERYRVIGYGNDHLTVRAIKRAIDGALGSRGAWLLEPYADLPSSAGLNTDDPNVIAKVAELAASKNLQLCVHAIGDRANRETLDIYEATFAMHKDKKDLRWRVEHAQHISAGDIPRFGKLGVIASMQGVHCTSDAPYVLARLGPKRAEEGAYVWRKLMDTKATVTNGTDAPVEDVDPIASYYASVSRKLKDGSVFFPKQRMTREEALRSYTINNAFAAFEESSKGTLSPGKLADITVLSKDILSIPEDEIPSAKVIHTVVGGKVVFSR